MNMRIGEWTIIQEAGKELVPLYGPGYTGLRNLGNRYNFLLNPFFFFFLRRRGGGGGMLRLETVEAVIRTNVT